MSRIVRSDSQISWRQRRMVRWIMAHERDTVRRSADTGEGHVDRAEEPGARDGGFGFRSRVRRTRSEHTLIEGFCDFFTLNVRSQLAIDGTLQQKVEGTF